MTEILLFGKLAAAAGKNNFKAAVTSVSDAVSFLIVNYPHLERLIAQNDFHVIIDEKRDISEQEIMVPGNYNQISFVPVIAGAGAVGRIIAGVLLIGAAFLVPGLAAIGFAGFNAAALSLGIGTALLLGGISELLTPEIELPEADDRRSFSLGNAPNPTAAGTIVPILYGESVVKPVLIAYDISTEDL